MIPWRTRNNFSPPVLELQGSTDPLHFLSQCLKAATGTLPTASFGNLHHPICLFPESVKYDKKLRKGLVDGPGMVIKSCCRCLPCVMIWEDSPPIASDHPGGNWNLRKGKMAHDQFQGKWSWRCLSHLVSLAVGNLILFRLKENLGELFLCWRLGCPSLSD